MSELDKNYHADELEIDIFDIIHDILKDWWLILMMGLATAMCTYIIANQLYMPNYTTSATFVVTSKGSNNTYANLSATNAVASNITGIFDSELIRKKVARDIGTDEVPGVIEAEVIPETNLFVLRVSAPSPETAFRIIVSIMENYMSITSHVFGNAIVDVMESPRIPMYPDNMKDLRQVMNLSFWIGVSAMTGILGVLSFLRDNIKNEKEVLKKLDTKLFGVIHHEKKYKTLRSLLRKNKKSILMTSPTVSFSFVENLKKMRAKLEYKASQNSYKVILVTSTLENEGKSTIAINLAISLAQKSRKVLFIDADLINPSAYKILNKKVADNRELGECLTKKMDLKDALIFDENSGLYLAIGSKRYMNSADLLVIDSFKEFVNTSKRMMDYIVIDAPPVSVAADAEILADIADASLLVVRQSTARTKDINDTVDILSASNSELLGCVFNNVRNNIFVYSHGYSNRYYKGYYGKQDNKVTGRV